MESDWLLDHKWEGNRRKGIQENISNPTHGSLEHFSFHPQFLIPVFSITSNGVHLGT